MLSPPHQSRVPAVNMPLKPSRAVAMLLGHGVSDTDRLADGRKIYARLRQKLLDEHCQDVAGRFRIKDVTR